MHDLSLPKKLYSSSSRVWKSSKALDAYRVCGVFPSRIDKIGEGEEPSGDWPFGRVVFMTRGGGRIGPLDPKYPQYTSSVNGRLTSFLSFFVRPLVEREEHFCRDRENFFLHIFARPPLRLGFWNRVLKIISRRAIMFSKNSTRIGRSSKRDRSNRGKKKPFESVYMCNARANKVGSKMMDVS